MNKFINWLKSLRRRILGFLEIENMINQSLADTNDLIGTVQELNSQLKFSVQQLQDYVEQNRKSIIDIEKSVNVLSSPEKLIPQLNAYTGKYYIALEYPPSRDYQARWGYTKPIHPGLSEICQKNFDKHCETLQKLASFKPFFEKINTYFDHENLGEPGWFKTAINAFDAALIYYFVADKKPKIYLEIGSGPSTLFAARAIKDNNLETSIISIDPEPRAEVDALCNRVIRAGLETCDLSIFSQLEAGDIVFLDGSHRSFMNSDVTVFMMDVLPILKPGIIIGIHDIFLPYDYPDTFKSWYWNEQYMLGVYLLAAAHRIEVLMPAMYMSFRPELESAFSAILEDWTEDKSVWLGGGSFWFTHQDFQEAES
ncbi:class I SAM-dependent methyltransferase [Crocosphaera sp. XPORK-15E]|uniref:class I SAM-dependent methyltransferase n=1 Tax=Crocosphaera sp. XPORK-15E TaxID=3110247 RepID=UPI002B1F6B67|nr:class I SAM-dependent methyltransferase [Crocosphaera sp. XPORK-15E]MEA5533098.1 class I SAM-dependent methyltransferase [Crocosphaera sp. XPORK-15E]